MPDQMAPPFAPEAVPGTAAPTPDRVRKVLLAEDDPVSSEIMVELLTLCGAPEVTTVTSGRDALVAALTRPYDLLILDRNLPSVSGDRIIRALRTAATPNRTTTIILATAELDAIRPGDPDAYEANLFLPKPLDAGQFIARVTQILDPA